MDIPASNSSCDEIISNEINKQEKNLSSVAIENLSEKDLLSEIDAQDMNLGCNELDDFEESLLGTRQEILPGNDHLSGGSSQVVCTSSNEKISNLNKESIDSHNFKDKMSNFNRDSKNDTLKILNYRNESIENHKIDASHTEIESIVNENSESQENAKYQEEDNLNKKWNNEDLILTSSEVGKNNETKNCDNSDKIKKIENETDTKTAKFDGNETENQLQKSEETVPTHCFFKDKIEIETNVSETVSLNYQENLKNESVTLDIFHCVLENIETELPKSNLVEEQPNTKKEDFGTEHNCFETKLSETVQHYKESSDDLVNKNDFSSKHPEIDLINFDDEIGLSENVKINDDFAMETDSISETCHANIATQENSENIKASKECINSSLENNLVEKSFGESNETIKNINLENVDVEMQFFDQADTTTQPFTLCKENDIDEISKKSSRCFLEGVILQDSSNNVTESLSLEQESMNLSKRKVVSEDSFKCNENSVKISLLEGNISSSIEKHILENSPKIEPNNFILEHHSTNIKELNSGSQVVEQQKQVFDTTPFNQEVDEKQLLQFSETKKGNSLVFCENKSDNTSESVSKWQIEDYLKKWNATNPEKETSKCFVSLESEESLRTCSPSKECISSGYFETQTKECSLETSNNVIKANDSVSQQTKNCLNDCSMFAEKPQEEISGNFNINKHLVNEIVDASISSTEFLYHQNVSNKLETYEIVNDILNDVINTIFENKCPIPKVDYNGVLEENINSNNTENCYSKSHDVHLSKGPKYSELISTKGSMEETISENIDDSKMAIDSIIKQTLYDFGKLLDMNKAVEESTSSDICLAENPGSAHIIETKAKETLIGLESSLIVLSILDGILLSICDKGKNKTLLTTTSYVSNDFVSEKVASENVDNLVNIEEYGGYSIAEGKSERIIEQESRFIACSILNDILSKICDKPNKQDPSSSQSDNVDEEEEMEFENIDNLANIRECGGFLIAEEKSERIIEQESQFIASSILDDILSKFCGKENKHDPLGSQSPNVVEEEEMESENIDSLAYIRECGVFLIAEEKSERIVEQESRFIASSILDDILSKICDKENKQDPFGSKSANFIEEEKMESEYTDNFYNLQKCDGYLIPDEKSEISTEQESRLIACSIVNDILSIICNKKNQTLASLDNLIEENVGSENYHFNNIQDGGYLIPEEKRKQNKKQESRLIVCSILDDILTGICNLRNEKTCPLNEFFENIVDDIIKEAVKDDYEDSDENDADGELTDWDSYQDYEYSHSPTFVPEELNVYESETKIINILSNMNDPRRLENVGFKIDNVHEREEFNINFLLKVPGFENEIKSEFDSHQICLDIIEEIIDNVAYKNNKKRKSEDVNYSISNKIARYDEETSEIVAFILDDVLCNVFEKTEIISDILNEIVNKAVDSVENKNKRNQVNIKSNMPFILDTKTISPETFKKLQGPVRKSTRIRTKLSDSLEFTPTVIKDEPFDFEINIDDDDELDIKPILPLPEELLVMAADKLKKQKKVVVKRNKKKAKTVSSPSKGKVKTVEAPKKVNRTIVVPKDKPIGERFATLPRAAKSFANELIKLNPMNNKWKMPQTMMKPVNTRTKNEIVSIPKRTRNDSDSSVPKQPPSKRVKMDFTPQASNRRKVSEPPESPPVIAKLRRRSPVMPPKAPAIEISPKTRMVAIQFSPSPKNKMAAIESSPSPPKKMAAINICIPAKSQPKIQTARKSTSLPAQMLNVGLRRNKEVPLILRRSPVASRVRRPTPILEVTEDPIVFTPTRRRGLISPEPCSSSAVVAYPNRRVAVKSTASRPVNVARKRGKLYVKPNNFLYDQTYEALSPSYEQDYESNNFVEITTTDEDHCRNFYIDPCSVRLERNSYIDHLLPNKGKSREAICELCEPKRFFVSKDGLVEHLKKEHNDTFGTSTSQPTGSRCPGCDKKYFSHNRLTGHMKICPAVTALSSKSNIEDLPSTSVGKPVEEELKHHCHICGAKFSMWTAYKAHKKTHVQKDHDPLNLEPEDDGSSKQFKSVLLRRGPGLVLQFRREKEPAPQPTVYKCEICNLGFLSSSDLDRHRVTHVRIKEERMSPEVEIIEEFLVKRPITAPSEPTVMETHPVLEPIVKGPTARKRTGVPRRPETGPRLLATAPRLLETAPRLLETAPRLLETVPRLLEAVPCFLETAPRFQETAPRLLEAVPRFLETAPRFQETAPRFQETAPRFLETVPRLLATAPLPLETAPRPLETSPKLVNKKSGSSRRKQTFY